MYENFCKCIKEPWSIVTPKFQSPAKYSDQGVRPKLGPKKMEGAQTTKLRFSRIRNVMIFYPKNTKVAVEVPTYQEKLHTKFEENHVKCFRDMSEQTFEFFKSLKFGTLVGRQEAIT